MAHAGVEFLVEKVRNIGVHYGDLIGSATHELKELEKELESLHVLLSESRLPDHMLMMKMRDIVYQVEDTLDTCLSEAVAAKSFRKKRFISRRFAGKSISVAERVWSLRQEKVKEMMEIATMVLKDNHSPSSGAQQLSTNMVKKVCRSYIFNHYNTIIYLFCKSISACKR